MDIVSNQQIMAHKNITRLPPLEALEEPFQTLITMLYTLTAIIAFFLNTFALIVLLIGKKTSLELRKYLVNLAIVDLLLAVFSIPFSYTDFMFGRWLFPLCLCPITNFVTTTAVFVNIYTLVVIGFGRFVYIIVIFFKLLFEN
jgi:Na+/H+ antiporter NhaA